MVPSLTGEPGASTFQQLVPRALLFIAISGCVSSRDSELSAGFAGNGRMNKQPVSKVFESSCQTRFAQFPMEFLALI